MNKFESWHQDEQNENLENKNEILDLTKWKHSIEVKNIIEQTEQRENKNFDKLLDHIPQSLDAQGEIYSKKDTKQANNLIKKILDKFKKKGIIQYNEEIEEKTIPDIFGKNALNTWSCFGDDGK